MKRLFAVIAIFVSAFILTSCYSEKDCTDAYNQGYRDAVAEYQENLDWEYKQGYKAGQKDANGDTDKDVFGYDGIINKESVTMIKEEAERYASEAYDWSPEEACEIIICYSTGEKFIDAVPTNEEYAEAVITLMDFYGYFYNY